MNTLVRVNPFGSVLPGFLRDYFVTMRPYLLFLSGATGIAGASFARDPGMVRGISIFAAAFLSYGFGQALTDCFQVDTDSISSPYRPLTQGRISRRATLLLSVAGLGACIAVFTLWNPVNIVPGITAGLGLFTYTWFKKRWWAGPAYNAWIVGALFLMAALAAGADPGAGEGASFIWVTIAVFFGYANFVLTGYFKDVGADRSTGYHTLPVVYGRFRSALVSDLFAAMTGIAVAMSVRSRWPEEPVPGTTLFLAGGYFFLVLGQVRLHANRSDDRAHRAIVPVVHSYVLFMCGLASLQHGPWTELLFLYYLAFSVMLALRPERHQI